MIYFEEDFFSHQPVFNDGGQEGKLYLIDNHLYKIYKHFPYNEEKIEQFKNMKINHVALAKDAVVEGTTVVGYQMDPVVGKLLSDNHSLESIIEASKWLGQTVRQMSEYHLVPADMNIDNIMLDIKNRFNLVDTYGYLIYDKLSPNILFSHNMKRINEAAMCGLIDHDWRVHITQYFKGKLPTSREDNSELFLYDIFKNLQTEFECEDVKQLSKTIKDRRK